MDAALHRQELTDDLQKRKTPLEAAGFFVCACYVRQAFNVSVEEKNIAWLTAEIT